MYQQKQIIKNTCLCVRNEDHIYTCSMPSPGLVLSQYDAGLRVLQSSPAIQFHLWAFSPSSIVFIDGQNQKTGLLSKSDLSVSVCDYFLRGLREHSIIPGQEKYIGTIGNDRCGMVDLQRNTIEKTWRNEKQSGFIMALPNGFLEYGSMPSGSKIFYRDYDDQLIWQTDVTEKGSYQQLDSKGK